MTLDDQLINKLKSLSANEKLAAMQVLLGQVQSSKKKHKITELAGLGKGTWKDVDAQEYIDKERSTWQ